jgi:4-amino-4-deoxy-L-arabinose transferase-like glycosyltransferase
VPAEDNAPTTPEPVRDVPAPEPWLHRLREALLIAALALVLNFAGNGRISLWDRDEPRYAGCTREMRASGDYIHPTFNAEPRYHKPVLIYWLMLGGTALGGDNAFGARLVSALMGTGTVLLVWALGRRMFGRDAGRIAALMLATAPIVVAESKMATTDATLTFFLVACFWSLWELSKRESRLWVGVFWVALALATMTKGPVGPVLVTFAGAVAWWWGGPTLVCLRRLRWSWGVPIYFLITAPWYIAIGIISNGDFYRVSMGYHVVRRMTTGIETHGGFPGYYVALSLVLFFPWSTLLPAAVYGFWSRRRESPDFGFLLGWLVGPLLFLELVRTKLIHYYLPAYPAAALMGAWLVLAVARSEVNLRRWPLGRLSLGLLSGIGIGLSVALLAGALVLPAAMRWPCLALALVVAPGTLYAMERFQAGAPRRAAFVLVGNWAVALLILFGWLAPAIDPYRLSPLLARHLRDASARTGATPMLAGYKAPSVVYYYGEPVSLFEGRDRLVQTVRTSGPVVTALSKDEIGLLKREPALTMEYHELVRGVDVEHAKDVTLQMVVLKPRAGGGAASAPAAAVAGPAGEQPLVK